MRGKGKDREMRKGMEVERWGRRKESGGRGKWREKEGGK